MTFLSRQQASKRWKKIQELRFPVLNVQEYFSMDFNSMGNVDAEDLAASVQEECNLPEMPLEELGRAWRIDEKGRIVWYSIRLREKKAAGKC
jgi:hypothetical protein